MSNKENFWANRALQLVKNLNVKTMKESYVIAALIDDGSSAKLGSNGEMLHFDTIEEANNYIEELRGNK